MQQQWNRFNILLMEPIILGTNNNLNSTSLPVTRLGFSLNKLLAAALSYEVQKSDLKASTITFHNQHHNYSRSSVNLKFYWANAGFHTLQNGLTKFYFSSFIIGNHYRVQSIVFCKVNSYWPYSKPSYDRMYMMNNRVVFKWLSKNQNQSNYSNQSQQGQTAPWTNHNS